MSDTLMKTVHKKSILSAEPVHKVYTTHRQSCLFILQAQGKGLKCFCHRQRYWRDQITVRKNPARRRICDGCTGALLDCCSVKPQEQQHIAPAWAGNGLRFLALSQRSRVCCRGHTCCLWEEKTKGDVSSGLRGRCVCACLCVCPSNGLLGRSLRF